MSITTETAPSPAASRRDVVLHSLIFIAGFTLVFVAAGATASALGGLFAQYRIFITRVFGVVVIILGINMLGLFKLPFLAMDKRLQFRRSGAGYLTSFFVGVGFAAGWSPCIGPILAAVLGYASESKTVSQGIGLLFVYSMGLALPFLVTAFALQRVLPLLHRLRRYLPLVEVVSGLIVIGMGIVLVTNSFLRFTGWLYKEFPALATVGTGPEASGDVVSIGAVFIAGLVSFISPCVLPLVPVYISFLTGQSIERLLTTYRREAAAGAV